MGGTSTGRLADPVRGQYLLENIVTLIIVLIVISGFWMYFRNRIFPLSAYKFDCSRLVWKPIASLLHRREGCASAFSSGHAFVVGGRTPQEWTNRAEYFNPIANKWTEVSTSTPSLIRGRRRVGPKTDVLINVFVHLEL